MFKKYPKIRRLEAEENHGLLEGECYIQEKIDGANTSIWSVDGILRCGSRNGEKESGFRGFVDYARAHPGINQLLKDFPHYRLYGEWLVRHTLPYDEASYKQFYLFDIVDDSQGLETGYNYLPLKATYSLAAKHDIKTPDLLAVLSNPTMEDCSNFVGKSSLGPKGEGVVIKNYDFINKWGNGSFGKIVAQSFKEDNAIVFGGNSKKSEFYYETRTMLKYVNAARVRKAVNKLMNILDEKLDLKHTSRISNAVYQDVLTEEIWNIQKDIPFINFKKFKNLVYRKAKDIYHAILSPNPISVAYE